MGAVLLVALGAGFGGALRHGVNIGAARLLGPGYPFGTLIVNVAGSFVMGLLAAIFHAHPAIGPGWHLALATGVLGGFTTFSAFALDAGVMIERGAWRRAALYVALSLAGGIGGLFLGLALGA